MKNIYKILALSLTVIINSFAYAQENETISIPLSNPDEPGKLLVSITEGDINVEGYSGKEVLVLAKSRAKNKRKYKSKNNRDGMRRIVDNGISYSIEEIDNKVRLRSSANNYVDFFIKVPTNFSVDLKTVNSSTIMVEGINGDHEVSNTNGYIEMKDISGSVIADALNQGMKISFASIDNSTTMMFSSLNGNVDITFPESLKANINARSDYGDIYTDFDIVKSTVKKNITKSTKNGVYKIKKEKGISGTINGGGVDLTFKTLNGDVIIRSN